MQLDLGIGDSLCVSVQRVATPVPKRKRKRKKKRGCFDLFRIPLLNRRELAILQREKERQAEEDSVITMRPIHLGQLSTEQTLRAIKTFAKA